MQAPRRYPVGVQVFEKIRTQGYLYVDKTAYVWDLVSSDGEYRFLSRPRRFGKTLLVSTLEAYFQGRRELFAGLAIEKLDARDVWPAHPVLRLDLSQFKSTEERGLREKFDRMFRPYEEAYGITSPAEQPGVRLDDLIRAAAATPEGRANGVAVLIDEYDAPLLNVMHDPERLQRFREIMREFYSPLKANEGVLRFVFITGISKFSQLSIFSELNNLLNVSMLPRYAGICGITADELGEGMAADVAWLAERLGISAAECREELRRRYDGYRFAKESPDVYNPFSLVTALSTGELGNYWFGSGTPTALVNMLRGDDVTIPELEGVEVTAETFDAPTEGMGDPVAFMYQSGYLTIKEYRRLTKTYILGVPNAEVAEGLSKTLLPFYTGCAGPQNDGLVARLTRALALDDDMDEALRQLRSYLAATPYDLAARGEKDFQAALYHVFRLVGANIGTEVRTATGRVDVVVDAPKALYVMELKYRPAGKSRPNSADALRQIDDRDYLIPYEAGGKPIYKVGVAFSGKSRTIDEGWVIERAS